MSRPPGPLSAFLTSLPPDFPQALLQAQVLGFTHVDVVALVERPPEHLEALADSGLIVSCASLGRDLPEGHSLAAPDVEVRRRTLQLLQAQVADAARLGAVCAYLVPGPDEGDLARTAFGEGCCLLADYAAARQVRLCVEHTPGRMLPTATEMLDWLTGIDHPNLGLLLDVGHCLLTREDPVGIIRRAGPRLGYVHLDDNDGVGDLHWPLLTGRLTEEQLRGVAEALREIGYQGGMALELSPRTADPIAALREGKGIVERVPAR
jgi:sugar phosphate isomerase/epimerase